MEPKIRNIGTEGQHRAATPVRCRWFGLHYWVWDRKLTFPVRERCIFCEKSRALTEDND